MRVKNRSQIEQQAGYHIFPIHPIGLNMLPSPFAPDISATTTKITFQWIAGINSLAYWNILSHRIFLQKPAVLHTHHSADDNCPEDCDHKDHEMMVLLKKYLVQRRRKNYGPGGI